jgi:Putative Flp pilus-assembly TadE/G-like
MATLFVVLMMPLLLVLGALVFDGARQRPYKREAQGRADAAAVASALGCSKGACAPGPTAAGYEGNGVTVGTPPPSCDSLAGSCTVTMHEPNNYHFTTGSNEVPASATAKWGALGSATGVFPVTIAVCGIQSAPLNTLFTLYSDDVIGCGNGPGQFGLVDNGCGGGTITIDATTGQYKLTVAQGNSFQTKTGCTTASFNTQFLNKTVLVPIWDNHVGNEYYIKTFAQFTLTAWSANGNASSDPTPFAFDGVHVLPPPNKNPKNCPVQNGHDDASGACIQGKITGYTTEIGKVVPGSSCLTTAFACLVYLDH